MAAALGRLTRRVLRALVASAANPSDPGDPSDQGDPAQEHALVRALHRMLVLRLCEQRGLEPAHALGDAARSAQPYEALDALFRAARARYGGLFGEPLPPALGSSPDIVAGFVEALYTAGMRKLLARASIEAVGQAYEQCLASCRQRKAGGIFYTPIRIADLVLSQTLDVCLAADSAGALGSLGAGSAGAPDSLRLLDSLRLIDPACGSGVFLLRAYRRLLDAHLAYGSRPDTGDGRAVRRDGRWTLTWAARMSILDKSIHGVDRDVYALELARFSLMFVALEHGHGHGLENGPGHGHGHGPPQLPESLPMSLPESLPGNLVWGDSLLGPDCHEVLGDTSGRMDAAPPVDWASAPWLGADGAAFQVVIGNPPWGQKRMVTDKRVKAYVQRRYPSSRGIFDWFRPFVELALRLTERGGFFGMVLPDIVLLKNYEPTRRLLLERLALTNIEWLGMAFAGATIDAVTITGRRADAHEVTPGHRLSVVVHDPETQATPETPQTPATPQGTALRHRPRQDDFRDNPRSTFNLYLTEDRRVIVRRLQRLPRLGDFFEAHEGIHSGNMRAELFVEQALDDSCRPLLFGRDELRPYVLRWRGRHVRLSALPSRRTRARYANLGQVAWHEQDKLLVRRTGDRVTAALDREHRFASNNFFVVIPKAEIDRHPLTLDGLCALLNSGFMTWYFRTIEPRKGRVFAELKIKHLIDFPLPSPDLTAACARLDELGARRRTQAERMACTERDIGQDIGQNTDQDIGHDIDMAALDALGLEPSLSSDIRAAMRAATTTR